MSAVFLSTASKVLRICSWSRTASSMVYRGKACWSEPGGVDHLRPGQNQVVILDRADPDDHCVSRSIRLRLAWWDGMFVAVQHSWMGKTPITAGG